MVANRKAPLMNSTITLNGVQVELNSDEGRAFVVDATRAGEGVIDDATLMEKYELTTDELQAIANMKAVGRAIRSEREHRLRSGIATRELASGYFFKAPKMLDKIMSDEQANPRARIESAKELRVISTPENRDSPMQSEQYRIVINLGGESEVYTVSANDVAPDAKLAAVPKLVVSNEVNDE
jgi:hypothetical protein